MSSVDVSPSDSLDGSESTGQSPEQSGPVGGASSGTGAASKKSPAKSTKKATAKKAASKKAVAKKAATKKAATKKAATKKAATKKAATKKTTTKKAATKKTATKKAATKKAATKKATTKKAATKKADTKKATTKKAATKKAAGKADSTEEDGKKKGSKKDGAGKGKKSEGKDDSKDKSQKKKKKNKSKKSSERSRGRRGSRRHGDALPEAESGPSPENRIMLVNEVPGVECRIALLENGRLDEYFVERASSATVVGNIYKARVTNIEPAIQAAFVDFGLGESGFLHVSDLHPKYFPGADLKEQVGKKIPRKQRPPIQDALKKGQEILVQVLKQGIGTKGPTVTSYLSIPGRLMVMMPDMDRVGVSRKVADDDERKRMREILDSLDLPDNFGFIVRTAGFESSKLELKRDVAYLKRLWEQMDRRIQNTGAPCLLYAESDLLIRTIRDVLDASIKTIVTDHPAAFERARSFLKVSGVTAGPDVRYYDRNLPLFSAFGAEKQIASLHLREVPLVSGGALVIEQTEALVAIDVNSGRSRSAKDSETNAFETNKEAVDEICRQLRLRDLGGLIVNDLIDMRHQKHREEIERRIMRNLKRDRAKSTVLPISEFGIVEMTRQRMRPNTKKANFDLCPTCEGTGEAPRPDSVAADALRRAGVVLENEQVRRIELVCSRSIANILSVDKKKEIELFEERSSRKIDVQVSENILEKRVDIYAYDEEGADVEINKQVRLKVPKIADLPTEIDPDDARNAKKSGKRRRRRGRGKNPPADATAIALSGGFDIDDEFEDELDASPDATGDSAEESSEEGSESGGRRKRRRRRRGRGRRRKELEAEQRELESKSIRIYALAKELGVTSKEILERCREAEGFDNLKNHMSSLEGDPLLEVRGWFRPEEPPVPEEEPGETEAGDGRAESPDDEDGKPRRRRRRRRGRRGRNRDQEDGGSSSEERAESSDDPGTDASGRTSDSPDGEDGEDRPRKRRRRRRGRGRRRSEDSPEQESGSNDEAGTDRESPDRGEKRPGAEDPPRESGSAGKDDGESGSTPETGSNSSSGEPAPEAPAKPKRRSLYGGRMRRVSNTGRPAED